MKIARPLAAALAALAIAGIRLPAVAKLDVDTETIVLSAHQHVRDVTVANTDEYDRTVQVTLSRWDEDAGGKARLEPSDDLVVAPSVFTLKARATQTIRVGLRALPDDRSERAYRLRIKEVASDFGPGLKVGIAVEISLPAFVQPAVRGPRTVAFDVRRGDGKHVELHCANDSNTYVGFSDLELASDPAFKNRIFEGTPIRYVLAEHARDASIELERPLATDRLYVRYSSGRRQTVVAATVRS